MPSDSSTSRSWSRRALLTAAGFTGLASVGTVSGYRLVSQEADDIELTRQLAVEDEFDLEETSLEPAGEDGPDSGEVSHRCNPDPDDIKSRNHTANLTMIDAWNEDYRMWGDDEEETGVHVQNSVMIEKAPERVDEMLLYGMELYSLCHAESDHLSQLNLQRMENEITADSAVEIETVLPSERVRPEHGPCTMTVMRQLPSGWNAGYEKTTWVNEGVIEADHDDETDSVTLSFDGEIDSSVAMKSLVELRSEEPLAELGEVFTWRIHGDATRRGW